MAHEQIARWQQLKDLNEQAHEDISLAKLDSSLKKNLGFIRKVKTFNAESSANVLKDAKSLTLDKYLSEITKSFAEGVLRSSKNDDLAAALELISVLHQRFGADFTPFFASYLINAALFIEEKPTTAQKAAVRLLVDMSVVSVCSILGDCDISVLTDSAKIHLKGAKKSSLVVEPILNVLFSHDVSSGYALSFGVALAKRYSAFWEPESSFISSELLDGFKQSMETLCRQSLEEYHSIQKKLAKLEEQAKKASIRTGKLLDEYKQPLEELQERNTLFETNLPILVELLGLEVDLADYQVEIVEEKTEVSPESTKVWWDDSKERDFYTDVPNYTTLLEAPLSSVIEQQYANLAEGEKVNLFIGHLENMTSEDDIQNATVELHKFLPYNKATKNRLTRFFVESKKVDVIDLYARFLCINSNYLQDLILDVVDSLDRGFRSQIYRGTIDFKNIAFFVELVKFKLIPSHVVFHKIRKMTLNIAGTSNGDILSIFYEKCGKFLLFEPDYAETTKELLGLLREQTKSDKLTVNEKSSLTNLFLIIDSFINPQNRKVVKTSLSDTQEFMHVILKRILTNDNHEKALKLCQDMNLQYNEEAQNALLEVFSKPDEMRQDTYESAAKFLIGLGKDCKFLVIRVLDLLHEHMIRGLEINEYRLNARRVAQMKLLAAFYNCNMVSFQTVLDCLFKIVCFGYPGNLPSPRVQNGYDAPDNYFRVSLVCTALNCIDFKKVKAEKLLMGGVKTVEGFLFFLNYYTYCKHQPLPRDVDFSILSVLERFGAQHPKRPSGLAEAVAAFQEYTVKHSGKQQKTTPVNEAEDDIESSDSGTDSEPDNEVTEEIDDTEEVEASDDTSEESDADSNPEDEMEEFDELAIYQEELGKQRLQQSKIKKFDLQIKELLAEAESQAKSNVALKIPAPPSVNQTPTASDTVQFNFLSKNRVKEFRLPSDNKFTERIATERDTQRANREKIMSLVNNMDAV